MPWDVVIVGGGPAGLSLALFLAAREPRLASRILVLERARYPRDKICAGAIGDRAERLLRNIGVDVDVPSSPIRGIAVTTREGHLVTRSDRVAGRVVRRREFDAALAKFVAQRGIEIRQGAAVRGLKIAHDGARLDVDGETLRTRVVIGADGVGSVVRRALGFARGMLVAQVAEVDTERMERDVADDVVHFDLSDRSLRGYAWDFPTPLDGTTQACRGVYDLRVDSSRESSLKQRRGESVDLGSNDVGARLRAHLSGATELGAAKRFSERGIEWHAPMSKPRVLLVGESAGIDPILGEGIAQAILYGKCAADYLIPRLAASDLAFDDWRSFVRRSRLGLDLSVRALSIPLVYGGGRSVLERWVTHSHSIAHAGLSYFGGDHVERADLARAARDLGSAFFSSAFFRSSARRS